MASICARSVCTVKAFPDMFHVMHRNPNSIIFHDSDYIFFLYLQRNFYNPTFSSIKNSIGYEIDNHPDIETFIHLCINIRSNLSSDRNFFFLCDHLLFFRNDLCQFTEIYPLFIQLLPSFICPG